MTGTRKITVDEMQQAIILPVQTREASRAFLHVYSFKDQLYLRVSYSSDGAMRVVDLMKYCLLLKDAVALIGAGLYAMLEGSSLLKVNRRHSIKYLTRESLQLAINAAFEPSELTFERFKEKYEGYFIKGGEAKKCR